MKIYFDERKSRKSRKPSAGNDCLTSYLHELDHLAPIPREEEDEIAKKAVLGDTGARSKLIKSNLRFVVSIAKHYQGKGLHLSDLISEGNLGLVIAADRFDPSRGYHFVTYAVWWIRQAILKAIYDKSRLIRLPVNRVMELIQIEIAGRKFDAGLGMAGEINRVARELNMPEKDVRLLLWMGRAPVSLDAPLDSRRPDSSPIAENIHGNGTLMPEETMMYRLMLEDIERSLDELSDDREASVIRYHFGLGDRVQMSLYEVGCFLGITKERARQLEKKALKHLGNPAMADRLKPYCA